MISVQYIFIFINLWSSELVIARTRIHFIIMLAFNKWKCASTFFFFVVVALQSGDQKGISDLIRVLANRHRNAKFIDVVNVIVIKWCQHVTQTPTPISNKQIYYPKIFNDVMTKVAYSSHDLAHWFKAVIYQMLKIRTTNQTNAVNSQNERISFVMQT